jgi:NTP pyrophosphatase (non-canonical NTP hydrolase)
MHRTYPNEDKMKNLNELRDKAFAYAERQGFHENRLNFGERLMLVVSELAEALEADREGKWACLAIQDFLDPSMPKAEYENRVRGTVQEELADTIIRVADIAGIYKIDLDWHVKAKMAYNQTRPYKHGKKYG